MNTYGPRGAFRNVTNQQQQQQKPQERPVESHAFGRLDLVGANTLRLVGFALDVLEDVQRELQDGRENALEYGEVRTDKRGEREAVWTVRGKPWKDGSFRTDVLLTLVCSILLRHHFSPTARVPSKNDVLLSLTFSRPLRYSNQGSKNRSAFAIVFPSARDIRLVSAPQRHEDAIRHQIENLWYRDIAQRRNIENGNWEYRLKSSGWFSSKSSAEDQIKIDALVQQLDANRHPILTSLTLHSRSPNPDFFLFDCDAEPSHVHAPLRPTATTATVTAGPPIAHATVSKPQNRFQKSFPPTSGPSKAGRGFSFFRRSRRDSEPGFSTVTTTTTVIAEPERQRRTSVDHAGQPGIIYNYQTGQPTANSTERYNPVESAPLGNFYSGLYTQDDGKKLPEQKGKKKKTPANVQIEEEVDIDAPEGYGYSYAEQIGLDEGYGYGYGDVGPAEPEPTGDQKKLSKREKKQKKAEENAFAAAVQEKLANANNGEWGYVDKMSENGRADGGPTVADKEWTPAPAPAWPGAGAITNEPPNAREAADAAHAAGWGAPITTPPAPPEPTPAANPPAAPKVQQKGKKKDKGKEGSGEKQQPAPQAQAQAQAQAQSQSHSKYTGPSANWTGQNAQSWEVTQGTYQGGKGSVTAYTYGPYNQKSTGKHEIWYPSESARTGVVVSPKPLAGGKIVDSTLVMAVPRGRQSGGLFGTPSPPPKEEIERLNKEAEAKWRAEMEKKEEERRKVVWKERQKEMERWEKERQLHIQQNGGSLQGHPASPYRGQGGYGVANLRGGGYGGGYGEGGMPGPTGHPFDTYGQPNMYGPGPTAPGPPRWAAGNGGHNNKGMPSTAELYNRLASLEQGQGQGKGRGGQQHQQHQQHQQQPNNKGKKNQGKSVHFQGPEPTVGYSYEYHGAADQSARNHQAVDPYAYQPQQQQGGKSRAQRKAERGSRERGEVAGYPMHPAAPANVMWSAVGADGLPAMVPIQGANDALPAMGYGYSYIEDPKPRGRGNERGKAKGTAPVQGYEYKYSPTEAAQLGWGNDRQNKGNKLGKQPDPRPKGKNRESAGKGIWPFGSHKTEEGNAWAGDVPEWGGAAQAGPDDWGTGQQADAYDRSHGLGNSHTLRRSKPGPSAPDNSYYEEGDEEEDELSDDYYDDDDDELYGNIEGMGGGTLFEQANRRNMHNMQAGRSSPMEMGEWGFEERRQDNAPKGGGLLGGMFGKKGRGR